MSEVTMQTLPSSSLKAGDVPPTSLAEEIMTRGYSHRRGFLNQEEIRSLKRLYDKTEFSNTSNYPIRLVSNCSVVDRSIIDKIDAVQRSAFPQEELFLACAAFFSVMNQDLNNSVNFPYHQDYEHLFTFQDQFYYLNLYVVLEKEDIENSNVTIIPFDAIKRKDPKLHQILKASGATRFREGMLVNDNFGVTYKSDVNFEEISVTPKLDVGDLLLMRGDLVHRTQNQKADRIAVSFRAVNKMAVANRRKLVNLSFAKLRFINNDPEIYAVVDYIYRRDGVDFLAAEELHLKIRDLYAKFERGEHAGFKYHFFAFKIKIWLLMQFCRIFRIGYVP
jgi:hypothetical protein